MAVQLVDDVEVVNPCTRTIEALDGTAARVSTEFPVEELSAHRIVHSCEICFSQRLHMQWRCVELEVVDKNGGGGLWRQVVGATSYDARHPIVIRIQP